MGYLGTRSEGETGKRRWLCGRTKRVCRARLGQTSSWGGEQCLAAHQVTQGNPPLSSDLGFTSNMWAWVNAAAKYSEPPPQVAYRQHLFFCNSNVFLSSTLDKKMKAPVTLLFHSSQPTGLPAHRSARLTREGSRALAWGTAGSSLGWEKAADASPALRACSDQASELAGNLLPELQGRGLRHPAPANVFYAMFAPSIPTLRGAVSAE